ncbi:MAG: hypothetical protein RSB82_00920 [Victivallaceae bacterium]
MRKLFFITSLALFGATYSLQALPLGNPDAAGLLQSGLVWDSYECASDMVDGLCCSDICCREDCNSNFCDILNCQLGFYGDYVIDRDLKTNVAPTSRLPNTIATAAPTTLIPNVAYNQEMSVARMFTNAGSLTLNICQRLDLYGTIGTTNMHLQGPSTAFNLSGVIGTVFTAGTSGLEDAINNSVIEIDSRTDLCWSIGARATVLRCSNFSLGAEGQYFENRSKIDTLNILSNSAQFYLINPKGFAAKQIATNVLPATAPTKRAPLKYDEWQFGAGAAWKIGVFVPYIGMKWSKANCKMENVTVPQPIGNLANLYIPATPGVDPATTANQDFRGVCVKLNNLKVRQHWGVVAGSTLVDSQKMLLSLEARFIDELAFHVNGKIRF